MYKDLNKRKEMSKIRMRRYRARKKALEMAQIEEEYYAIKHEVK